MEKIATLSVRLDQSAARGEEFSLFLFFGSQTGHYSKLRIVGGNIDISTSNFQDPTYNGR